MSERWNTSNGKAGYFTCEISICFIQFFAYMFGDFFFVYTVRSASEYENGSLSVMCNEDKRFNDLSYFAADGLCSVVGSACAGGEFDDFE